MAKFEGIIKKRVTGLRAVALKNVQPEMILARTIYTSDGRPLLMSGVALKPSYVSRLEDCGITFIYIEDDRYGKIVVDDVVREETRVHALQTVKTVMEAAQAGPIRIQSREVLNTINSIMDELLVQGKLLVQLTDIRAMNDYTFGHSVAVAIFAMMTGIAMNYNQLQLKKLGVGALLHDIGKSRVPPEILNKEGRLTDEEFTVVRKHTVYGYEVLSHSEEIDLLSAHVAYQHHERYDGRGYPRGLKGTEIHEYGRIAALADVYDAMVTDRVYRRRHPPHEVVEFIVASRGTIFDPEIAQVFLQHIAIYPAGTMVRLNTGQKGIVIKVYPDLPTRPVVRVFEDASGQEIIPWLDLDLTQCLTTFITEVTND